MDDLKGGVAGGSILQGVLRVGQEIEVRPGIVTKDSNGKMMCKPIFSKVLSLCTEQNDLMYAVPGGLIGELVTNCVFVAARGDFVWSQSLKL